MRSTLDILADYKSALKTRFLSFVMGPAPVPENMSVPSDPVEALQLGMKIGRSEGYSEGLVEGAGLGLDVGIEAMDEMMSHPVVFGTPSIS